MKQMKNQSPKKPNNPSEKETPVRITPAFKLKDKAGRNAVDIDLKDMFGFLPEKIIVLKVDGKNNTIKVAGVLTDEAIAEEKLKNKDKVAKKDKK